MQALSLDYSHSLKEAKRFLRNKVFSVLLLSLEIVFVASERELEYLFRILNWGKLFYMRWHN